MREKYPVVTDAVERIVATFVVTVLGLATADGVDLQNALSIDNWKTWITAGVVAAFTLLKTIIAAQVSKRGGKATSASLAPSVQLKPEAELR
jgi:hypothetical protein